MTKPELSEILLHDAKTALMYEELRAAIDDGHESMTHADALAEIAAIRAENVELRAKLEAVGAGGVQALSAAPARWVLGQKITEEMHVAACKVLLRGNGLDGLPQRMLDAMLAASPTPPAEQQSMESVLVDGVAYQTPMPVACELLRLHLELLAATTGAVTPKGDTTTGAALGGAYARLPDFDSGDEPIWEAVFKWKTANPGSDASKKAMAVESAIIKSLRDFADRTHELRQQAAPKAAPHFGPLRDADAEYGKQLSVYNTPKAAPGEAAEPVAIVKWQLGGSLVAHLVGDVAEGDLLYKGAPPQQEAQEPTEIPEAIAYMAAERYKVVPSHESMFHRWAVVAGTGTQQLYLGREVECQNMARKFAGAFLDGAFVAMQQAAPQQEAQEPVAFMSPKQLAALSDPEGEHGAYLPVRKTCAGLFTQAIYTAPQPAPAPLASFDACDMATAAAQGFRDGKTAEQKGE